MINFLLINNNKHIIMGDETELFQKLISYNSDNNLPTLKNNNNIYYFGNQISTYELLDKICNFYRKKCNMYSNPRYYTEDDCFDTTLLNLYKIMKTNQEYGSYAGNNDWSPSFNLNQLKKFVSIAHQQFDECVNYYLNNENNSISE